MAVGELVIARTQTSSRHKRPDGHAVMPIVTDWGTCCDAPETADNSGSSIVNPALITRSAQFLIVSHGFGNALQVRLRYDDGLTSITNPVVQVFGKDGNGLWQKLLDKSGSHELTLTTASSTDLTDGTDCYTEPVEVATSGCSYFLVAVKTALAGTGTVNTSLLQARFVDRDVTPPLAVSSIAAGSAIIGSTKDAGPHWTSSFGVSSAVFTSADATTAVAVTDAPTAGQKLVIVDIVASSDTAMFLLFQCETTGTVIFKVFLPANGTVQITPRGKVKLATADKKLFVDASVAGNIAVTVTYYSEA